MAKKPAQGKSARSIRVGPLFIAVITATLLFLTHWYFSQPWPGFSKTAKNRVSASDGVTAAYCSPAAAADDLRHEPKNTTFYDDPRLSYSIEEPMKNWDEKRSEWLKNHPSYGGSGERILVVTGSQPAPCPNPSGDYLLLRLFKNKVDYCRINGYDIFYGNTLLHPKMRSYWAKLPLIRAAMLAHPESEWIWWVDSDAVFTDMDFKVPLRRYKDHNLVVHGWAHLVYEKKSWQGLNAGVFLIRNCQWSMDFMQLWASMGPHSPEYHKFAQLQMSVFADRFPTIDDQSALIYLLLKEKEKGTTKAYIEGEYYLQGYWRDVVGTIDDVKESYTRVEKGVAKLRRRHAEKTSVDYAAMREGYLRGTGYGEGSGRRPFVTHFTGCKQCNGHRNPTYKGDTCSVLMEKALTFADNQVLRRYGFVRPDLLNSSRSFAVPFDFPAEEGLDYN